MRDNGLINRFLQDHRCRVRNRNQRAGLRNASNGGTYRGAAAGLCGDQATPVNREYSRVAADPVGNDRCQRHTGYLQEIAADGGLLSLRPNHARAVK